jgi:hypothetical protein
MIVLGQADIWPRLHRELMHMDWRPGSRSLAHTASHVASLSSSFNAASEFSSLQHVP